MDSVWVSELGEHVAGSISLADVTDRTVRLKEFWIDPQWQSTAVVKKLVGNVHDYCEKEGCLALLVEAGTVPGWIVPTLGNSGFRLSRQEIVGDKSLYEFSVEAREAPEVRKRAISVLLADDHSLLRKGMADLLREQPEVEVVGEARDGREAVQMALAIHPDVVLMDVTMPQMDGIEATRRITAQLPGVRVIGLSMHEGEEMASAMRAAGASAYLCKSEPSDAIVAAVLQGV